jgi:hypothetical protein
MGSVGHEDLLVVEAVLRQLHSTPGGLHPSTSQIDSSHLLDQRDWSSHLGDIADLAAAEFITGCVGSDRKSADKDEVSASATCTIWVLGHLYRGYQESSGDIESPDVAEVHALDKFARDGGADLPEWGIYTERAAGTATMAGGNVRVLGGESPESQLHLDAAPVATACAEQNSQPVSAANAGLRLIFKETVEATPTRTVHTASAPHQRSGQPEIRMEPLALGMTRSDLAATGLVEETTHNRRCDYVDLTDGGAVRIDNSSGIVNWIRFGEGKSPVAGIDRNSPWGELGRLTPTYGEFGEWYEIGPDAWLLFSGSPSIGPSKVDFVFALSGEADQSCDLNGSATPPEHD